MKLAAALYVFAQDVSQRALEFQKILPWKEIPKGDDQTKQVPLAKQILISFFSYTKLAVQHSIWKVNLYPEGIQPFVVSTDISE